MKKMFLISCFVAIVLLSFTSAMAETAATPQVIKLKYSDNLPPSAGGNIYFKEKWLPKINQLIAPKYQLEVTYYHSSSLYKYQDQVKALEDGLIDFTIMTISGERARAPMHEVLNLPLMGWDEISSTRIWFDLDKNIPEFAAEYGKFVDILHFQSLPRTFHMKKKTPRSPEDFKGVKIQAMGISADILKSIGANPVVQHPGDWYTSLDRGVIDGIATGTVLITMFKLQEVADVHIFFADNDNLGLVGTPLLMNKMNFKKLPAEVQKAIEDNIRTSSDELTRQEYDTNLKSIELCKGMGHNFITLTQEETDKWRAAAKPLIDQWVDELEAKGRPARKVYNEAVRLAAEYKKK